MKTKLFKVPTGFIGILDNNGRKLEFLSIGDYGKDKNIKAEFLGFMDEIHGVPHGELLPLSEKWVITISTQLGCSMKCNFCDVPKVGLGINASYQELIRQVIEGLECHPDVDPRRINLHFARMGEPTFNPAVVEASYFLRGFFSAHDIDFHPVVSTMMPKANKDLSAFLGDWLKFRSRALGDAGLQLSINTTNEDQHREMFGGCSMPVPVTSGIFQSLLHSELNGNKPWVGRKIALNFALTGAEIDPAKLREWFDPRFFLCKLTPLHATSTATGSGHKVDGYTTYDIYRDTERALIEAGFDVIVFVPSKEEDESRITCGNAILSNNFGRDVPAL